MSQDSLGEGEAGRDSAQRVTRRNVTAASPGSRRGRRNTEDAFMQEPVSVRKCERDGFKDTSHYKCNVYRGYWKFEKQRKEGVAVNSPPRDDC